MMLRSHVRLACWFPVMIWLLGCLPAQADITLAKIFSDHMVLQQKSKVKVWGTAEPGDELVLSFKQQTVEFTAAQDGSWSAFIDTPAAGGPYEITVTLKKGGPKVLVSDVMIGEVWICSGQSNMEWKVSQALNPQTEKEQAKAYTDIRFFSMSHSASPKPVQEFMQVKPWDCCSTETVSDFSAVAYFFGRELYKKLNVPIGLIDCSWGGTRAEAWISEAGFKDIKELDPLLEYWRENDNPTSQHRPSNLFNGMVHPLKGYQFKGVIWYQGESNVGRGQQYATLFPALIKDWRSQLAGGSEFPFYFVQLAPYRYDAAPEALPEVWDSQLKTFKNVSQVGMVVTTDVGDPKDIHPKNKQAVGERLAFWAIGNTYRDLIESEPVVPSGPIYESMGINNGEIRLSFRYNNKLRSRDGKPLSDFTVCGEDGKFFPAEARIEKNVVVLKCEQVPDPKHVRFAWYDTANPNLVNKDGLPASPFRTDDFPLLSVGKDY